MARGRSQFDRPVRRLLDKADAAKRSDNWATHEELLAKAADLLVKEKHGEDAIDLYVQEGNYYAAAGIAERVRKWDRAAPLWVKVENWEKAALAKQRCGEGLAAAELFERAGSYETAATFFEKHNDLVRAATALAKANENVKAANLLVRALKGQGHLRLMGEEAREACRRAGVLYAKAGDIDRAVGVLKLGGQNTFAGQVLARAGRHGQAIELLVASGDLLTAAEIARSIGDNQRASILLATRAMKEGRLLESARHFEEAEQFQHAARLYEYAKEPLQAAAMYERAGVHQAAAPLYESVGRYEDAARCLGAAESPAQPTEEESTSDTIEEAKQLLALARSGASDRYVDVVRMLSSVPEDRRDFVRARTMLAMVLIEQEDRQAALNVLHQLTSMTPTEEHLAALYQYGKLLEHEGRLAKAREAYRAAHELNPKFMDVAERLAQIEDSAPKVPQAPISSTSSPLLDDSDDLSLMRPESLLGTTLRGRFRLEKLLGSGSQAHVYVARDVVLDRSVAIKVLSHQVAQSADALERFLSEARLAAKVQHANCLSIHDFGQESGVTFIAMEYFDGETLRDRMGSGRIPPEMALLIAKDIAEALGAVHKSGIVHRDVKPSNIMINAENAVRLTDFGVAVSFGASSSTSGKIIGTLIYMAPEQGCGEALNDRTDIYSLGVVLFEMLSGEVPFEGTIQSLIARMNDPPPDLPSDVAVGPEVRAILNRCMQPDADERYSSIAELAQELDGAILGALSF